MGAQPKLSSDPVQLADDLVADEQALRDPSTSEAASGVGWNYLAAINLIETRFGSIDGVSTAGA